MINTFSINKFFYVFVCCLSFTVNANITLKPNTKEESIIEVARIYHASMLYIFSQQPLINAQEDNKNTLFGNAFITQVKKTYIEVFNQNFPNENNKYVARILRLMTLVMDENKTLLLDKDIVFKGFIPAVFAFQLSEKFKQRGYGINIKFTNFTDRIRNTLNAPDLWEQDALTKLSNRQQSFVLDKKATHIGKPAIRYMRPVELTPMCLSCHGEPKDNPTNKYKDKSQWQRKDKTGFTMEGWQLGELGGGISVVVYDEE